MSRQETRFGAVGIVLLTLFAYLPAMRGGYVWDDDWHVTANPTLRDTDGLRRIWLERGATPQYYPLVHTTFWVEYQLWHLYPVGYHVVNVLLHATVAMLLWLVLRRLSVPGAWFAAAIFAVHPVYVESVAWITERKNVLSGALYMGALLAYLRFARLDSPRITRPRRWDRYALALILFVAALLSKTVTSSLPAAVLLLLWWKRDRLDWRDVLPLVPMFVAGIAMGLNTAWMEKHHVGAEGTEWTLSLADRCLIAGRAVWFYLGKLVWPARLTFIYPRWQIDSGAWWQYLYPAAALTLVGALWLLRKRIGKGPLVAALFFGGTLVPALGFVDVYPMRYSFVADHFQYLASIGPIALFAALATTAIRAASRGIPAPAWAEAVGLRMPLRSLVMPAIILGALATLTWNQGYIYKNVETLWTDTLKKNPSAWVAHANLSQLFAMRGRADAAVEHNLASLRLNPEQWDVHYNMGVLMERRGQLDDAVRHFTEAARLRPISSRAHHSLAVVLFRQGRIDEAIDEFTEALRINPDDALSHNALGVALARKERFDAAVEHFRLALALNPGFLEAERNLNAAAAESRRRRGASH